jgi:quercetin dioxygenase-like cupin family protein
MKKIAAFLAGVMVMLTLSTSGAWAQNKNNMNPKVNEVLADTTFLKAYITSLEPGQKTDLHNHPAYFAYALTGGKLTVHYSDGTNETIELKPGMGMASGPEKPHLTENSGTSTVRFMVVELKEHPYKAPAMKK